MKLKECATLFVSLVFASIIAFGFLSHFLLPHDNVVEEACKEIMNDQTCLDVDLTPSSKEY